jgi:glycosyltransferase involved in cell wall biosynthesis
MPEKVGGTELYTHWLTQTLRQRGHQVTIFYRRSDDKVGCKARVEDGIHIQAASTGVVTPTNRFLATFRDPAMTCLFERVLDEVEPALVHVEHLMGHPVSLTRSIQRRGIPYMITLWDFWWICANAQLLTNYSQKICDGPQQGYLNCGRCALARADLSNLGFISPMIAGILAWRNRLLRQVMRGASTLIAPTEFVRRWYTAHHTPTENLVTLQPGLEQPATAPQSTRLNNVTRFAYIGGLSWQKGVHTVIEAFSGVRGKAELWIAGDLSSDPDYVTQLRSQATPRVRFLGRLSREKVWETLAQVDVAVVPSLWYETFSFIVSEAFIAHTPVIASHLGPLVDRVRDGIDGLLLPPGDVAAWREALQRLVDDPDLVARLRSNVRPPMTLEEHASRMETLYNQIIG